MMGFFSSLTAPREKPEAPPGVRIAPVGALFGKEEDDNELWQDEESDKEEEEPEKKEYVPLDLAMAKIQELQDKAENERNEHTKRLRQIQTEVEKMQDELKEKYVSFYCNYIKQVQAAARNRLAEQARAFSEEAVLCKAIETAELAALAASRAAQLASQSSEALRKTSSLYEQKLEIQDAAAASFAALTTNAEKRQQKLQSDQAHRQDQVVDQERRKVEQAQEAKHQAQFGLEEARQRFAQHLKDCSHEAEENKAIAVHAAQVAARALAVSENENALFVKEECQHVLMSLLGHIESMTALQPAIVQTSEEDRSLHNATDQELASLRHTNQQLLESNARLESSMLQKIDASSAENDDEATQILKAQLHEAVEGNRILREELLALQANIEAVNNAVENTSGQSEQDVQKMIQYARLQSRQRHEELKKAQRLIDNLKRENKDVKRELRRHRTNETSPSSQAYTSEEKDDDQELNDELAESRARVTELEAKIAYLEQNYVKEESISAKLTAHAEIVERKGDAVAEVAAATKAHAEASVRCAEIAAELAAKNEVASEEVTTKPAIDPQALAAVTDTVKAIGRLLKEAIHQGTSQWRAGKRAECYEIYKHAAVDARDKLPEAGGPAWALTLEHETIDLNAELKAAFTQCLDQAAAQPAARGAVTIRKGLDKIMERLAKKVHSQPEETTNTQQQDEEHGTKRQQGDNSELKQRLAEAREECAQMSEAVQQANQALQAVERGNAEAEADYAKAIQIDRERARKAELRATALEAQIDDLQAQLAVAQDNTLPDLLDEEEKKGAPKANDAIKVVKTNSTVVNKLRAAQRELRSEQAKVRRLEEEVRNVSSKGSVRRESDTAGPSSPVSNVSRNSAGANSGAPTLNDKKQAKALENANKKAEKVQRQSAAQVAKLETQLEEAKEELKSVKSERDALKKKIAELEAGASEITKLRERAEEAKRLEQAAKQLERDSADLEKKYKEEMALRKKYWNMMEDMKGKIRVFVRCRPMAKYEIQKNCKQVVTFVDDTTLSVQAQHGPKEFIFDNVFPPQIGGDTGQAAIFEDTSNLIQSCLDGFNVCIFAYGQTGSGKTWTMGGSRDNPELWGLTPRAIHTIYDNAKKLQGKATVKISSYFLELYNDNIVDLYEKLDNPNGKAGAPPKLDIKVDAKKMVFVKGAIIKPAETAEDLLKLFDNGNAKRHVGATKMNAESSRSHSIFAILLEVYDKTTKKTSIGKLSLVDLAGSERADKTGATADRLKEAQNINKSLSALGDVIAALSSGEKFIPYRNNKLTLLMQDSLGGNAKTLMFVNISPADYNADETVTSLTYAARVKNITNNATKGQDSEEVAALKQIIRDLKAGGSGDVADILV